MIKSLINLPVTLFRFLFNLVSKTLKWFSEGIKSLIALFAQGVRWFSGKLRQPAHTSALSVSGLIYSVVVAAGVFALFYFIPPSLTSTESADTKLTQVASLAGIALAGMLVCLFVLPSVLGSFYDEHEWTVGKQIIQHLLMVLVIGSGVIFFLNLTDQNSGKLLAGLLLVSLIPIIVLSFILESQLSKKFSSNAISVMSSIADNGVISHSNPLKVLVFKDGNEKLSLVPNQLIYVKTGKTESEFYYQNFFGVESTRISVDEKKVAEELKDHPQFNKFHGDYFVNVNGIKNVNGTARGYEIGIAKVSQRVKVSRKYRKGLEKL